MSEGCNGNCGSGGSCGLPAPTRQGVGRIIAVGSGKGGVGKSTVTGLLAVALRRAGYSVGILDADVTGPSIPKLFGVTDAPYMDENNKIQMPESKTGIRILSANLLLQDGGMPVIWRGPLISGAVKQFWEEGNWTGLDYAIIDLPPGTADSPLTVMQSIAVDGMFAVTTPQALSAMIVQKQMYLSKMCLVPILGLIENMSYAICPCCGKQWDLFGVSHRNEIEQRFGMKTMARIPIDDRLAYLCDNGLIEEYENSELMDTLVLASLKKKK